MTTNRSMPPGVIIPELPYPDVPTAVNWLCQSFGFVERLRIGDHRAQLSFGDGSIIVTRRPPEKDTSPADSANSSGSGERFGCSVMVRVTDIDSHYEQVKQFGAQIIKIPTDFPYGERQYVVADLGGHRWTFSQTLRDVNPETWGGTLFE